MDVEIFSVEDNSFVVDCNADRVKELEHEVHMLRQGVEFEKDCNRAMGNTYKEFVNSFWHKEQMIPARVPKVCKPSV